MLKIRRRALVSLTCSLTFSVTCYAAGASPASNAAGDFAHAQPSQKQVVSFGDSLSDVGTYAYARQFGGGSYTTNPGTTSVQVIAEHYGSHLTPALTGGFGRPRVLLQ